MKLILLCATLLLICYLPAFSQKAPKQVQRIPLIKAQSRSVDIRDGLHFRKGYWQLMPEKKPDRYFVELPSKPHRVFFYTDIDTLGIDVAAGGIYTFIILLNGKDSCYTQVIAAPKKSVVYRSTVHSESQSSDTIPFTMGKDSRLYLRASVNHSEMLNFQFDLGAGYSTIKATSMKKVNSKMDSMSADQERISNFNQLDIAGLHWDSLDFHESDHNMANDEDGLLGNSLFQNKILEINYDKMIMIIHDSLPRIDTGYSRHEMLLLDGVIPMFQASLATRDTSCTTWFIYDTGDSGNAWLDDSTATRFKLYRGVNRIISWKDRVIVKIPELRIANSSFLNISAIFAKPGTHTNDVSLLGNSLLKRFNVVIDNREGFLYMKPNQLMKTPYDNTVLLIYGSITAAVLLIILLIIIISALVRRSRRRRKLVIQEEYPEITSPE